MAADLPRAQRGAVRRRAPLASLGRRLGKGGTAAVLLAVMLAAGAAWLYLLVPHTPLTTIPCPFEYATGYECPGCGLQSSLTNLLALRFKYVLMANLLSPLLLPLFFIMVISWAADLLFDQRLWQLRIPRPLIVAAVILILAYGVLRNIPSLNLW
ncbi:MAG: DUF2752 domain-containing protein [Bacteroidota bacterium]|nr:DUF2752 domain-containing protein [Bacteroidota bacterium]